MSRRSAGAAVIPARRGGALVTMLVACLLACLAATAPASAGSARTLLPFDGATGWINTPPLTPQALQGKVVLVDFWEYTCVNCLRTLPYLRAWYQRYKQYGFVIVGVHRPEFEFSGEAANVAAAVKSLDIGWPVVLDSNSTIWDRYGVAFWPTDFLVDREGHVVQTHVGEGDYQATEAKIQSLIRRDQPTAQLPKVMALLPEDSYTKPGAVCYPQTPEVYVGLWRSPDAALGNREGYHRGHVVDYGDSGRGHFDGFVYLKGPWFNADQAMVHARADQTRSDYLDLLYHAIQVVAVLKPETGAPMTVYVEQDGKPLQRQDAGTDIRYDASGRSFVTVDAPRAYALVMNRHFGHHDLKLRPVEYGLGVYSFAFESCEVGADR